MSIFPEKNKDTDPVVSSQVLTGEGLREIMSKIPEGSAAVPVEVYAVSIEGTPLAPLTIVGIASNGESGALVMMVFPGTIEEWMAFKAEDEDN